MSLMDCAVLVAAKRAVGAKAVVRGAAEMKSSSDAVERFIIMFRVLFLIIIRLCSFGNENKEGIYRISFFWIFPTNTDVKEKKRGVLEIRLIPNPIGTLVVALTHLDTTKPKKALAPACGPLAT